MTLPGAFSTALRHDHALTRRTATTMCLIVLTARTLHPNRKHDVGLRCSGEHDPRGFFGGLARETGRRGGREWNVGDVEPLAASDFLCSGVEGAAEDLVEHGRGRGHLQLSAFDFGKARRVDLSALHA